MRRTTIVLLVIGLFYGISAPGTIPLVRAQVAQEPLALAPYAADDPIPKLDLKPHLHQDTPGKVVESFLSYLSDGLNTLTADTGGSVFGLPDGYQKAWALMGPTRPSLSDFKNQWPETVRLGVIQLEPISDTRFFVELQRVHWIQDHWASAFYFGEVTAAKSSSEWWVSGFSVQPENLVSMNLGGHQKWQQSIRSAAAVLASTVYGSRPMDWVVEHVAYTRRIATVHLRHKVQGVSQSVTLARLVEGRWVPLK